MRRLMLLACLSAAACSPRPRDPDDERLLLLPTPHETTGVWAGTSCALFDDGRRGRIWSNDVLIANVGVDRGTLICERIPEAPR